MPEIHFDRYYRYEALKELLHAYAQEYPDLVSVEIAGKSYEGRDIWILTVTNNKTGPASEKPALWVDGNIHASEVSPSAACLYLLNQLVMEYGKSAEITRCLDSRAFYICPRVNPDGAELALADQPRIIRSSTRPYPYDEEPLPGMESFDIDGDGRMLMMRIEDPNGPWKSHPDEPRLLIRREPTEVGGTYYRVLNEGKIEDYDGVTIQHKQTKQALDLNRNFPFQWRQENEQSGAGLYPTSEPEVHAIVEFITRHANITGAITFHTYSGVLLRPYGTQADDTFPSEDLWTYEKIGDKGTELTGYPHVSVYHDFRYHPKEVITGVFDDWLYDHYGLFTWTVEIWDPRKQAGIEDDYHFIDWFREHPLEHDFMLLKWSDEVLDGKAYVDWYEFDHPQLGKVELGGWDALYSWRNPPPQFLEKEVALFSGWLVWHLLISPRLEILETRVTALGDSAFHVELFLHNTGWLPTYVSKKALEKKVARAIMCEINLPEGAALKSGKTRMEIGHLEGRAYSRSTLTIWETTLATPDRAKAEWVIQGKKGDQVEIVARQDRSGTVRTTVTLE